MKSLYFINIRVVRVFSIFSIFLLLLNASVLYSFYSSSIDADQNNNTQLLNQVFNSAAESSCTKVNIKLLPESYSDNFYSYEYCIKNLSLYPKIFTIISETDSENNIRHSSFQLAQNTTST